MRRIKRVERRQVDLEPKVVRTDAIQSFVRQETLLVTIIDDEGRAGTAYTYTIGTGGSSVSATAVGAITSLAFSAIGSRVPRAWRVLDRAGRRRPHRRDHALAQGGAPCRDVQYFQLPTFPDGIAREPVRGRAERALGRVHFTARPRHAQSRAHRRRIRARADHGRARHRMELGRDRPAPEGRDDRRSRRRSPTGSRR